MIPDPGRETKLQATLTHLRELAEGLVYSSEGDHPFEVVHFADDTMKHDLTVATVRKILSIPLETPMQQVSLERVLGRHTVFTDPFDTQAQRVRPRYEALGEFLQRQLGGARGFRSGSAPTITVWLLARTGNGDVVGYRTLATET